MKVSKKILALMLSAGMLFVVGCSNNELKDVSETTKGNIATESNTDATEKNKEELNTKKNNKEISAKYALKLVKDKVKAITPEAKLKVRGREFFNGEDVYVVEYDTPFITGTTFTVDVETEEISVVSYEYYKNSMSDLKQKMLDIKQETPLSMEEAKALFLKIESTDPGEFGAFLSENQLANLELAEDYMIKTPYYYCWVFKYPMEKNQRWATEGEFTYDNSKSLDDKYGYIYIDPYKKEYSGYLKSEKWAPLE